jgi:hypothetical protein
VHSLHAAAHRSGAGATRGKEIPAEPGYRHDRDHDDDNVNAGHHELLGNRD